MITTSGIDGRNVTLIPPGWRMTKLNSWSHTINRPSFLSPPGHRQINPVLEDPFQPPISLFFHRYNNDLTKHNGISSGIPGLQSAADRRLKSPDGPGSGCDTALSVGNTFGRPVVSDRIRGIASSFVSAPRTRGSPAVFRPSIANQAVRPRHRTPNPILDRSIAVQIKVICRT